MSIPMVNRRSLRKSAAPLTLTGRNCYKRAHLATASGSRAVLGSQRPRTPERMQMDSTLPSKSHTLRIRTTQEMPDPSGCRDGSRSGFWAASGAKVGLSSTAPDKPSLNFCFYLFVLFFITTCASASDLLHAGPIFDHFNLTLAPGERTEAFGPFFYSEQKESQHTWAIPPFLSHAQDPVTDLEEFDFLYPIFSYDRYGQQHRWQFFELLSFSGGPSPEESVRDRFTLFPLYFQQRSSDPNQNYTAVGPFYGRMRNHLFRDEIFFVMFPLFAETRKKDVVTDNYVYPFFHLRHGDGLSGWQF